MTTQVQPLPKKVKDAVKRNISASRFLGPVMLAVFHLLMLALVAAGCVVGGYFLWQHALRDPRFMMDGEMLGIDGSVRECPESVDEIRAIGLRFSGRSVLDPLLVSDLRDAYLESVWVRKVTRLRRSFPNRVDLELLLRIPAAQVYGGGQYWMIDMDGMVLPVEGRRQPFAKLPEIIGVTANVIGHPPRPGEKWTDEGVRGGLGILQTFWASTLYESLPVTRIVVNAGVFQDEEKQIREIRRRFEVVTAPGAVVRWGTYNIDHDPAELTDAEKIWNLQELLRTNDAMRPGVCFDVRTRLPGFSVYE